MSKNKIRDLIIFLMVLVTAVLYFTNGVTRDTALIILFIISAIIFFEVGKK